MAESQLSPTSENPVTAEAPAVAATRQDDRYLIPPVDIFENGDGITVVVDLPGVPQDGVDVRVEEGVLTIQGRSAYRPPKDQLYREFSLTHFYRQFRLTDQIDSKRIEAKLRHGVLTLQLPKAEHLQPRKVEIAVES